MSQRKSVHDDVPVDLALRNYLTAMLKPETRCCPHLSKATPRVEWHLAGSVRAGGVPGKWPGKTD